VSERQRGRRDRGKLCRHSSINFGALSLRSRLPCEIINDEIRPTDWTRQRATTFELAEDKDTESERATRERNKRERERERERRNLCRCSSISFGALSLRRRLPCETISDKIRSTDWTRQRATTFELAEDKDKERQRGGEQ
jgi:hypothetical protein